MMTYKHILDCFYDTFPSAEVDDYRPICHEIYEDSKVGMTIWLKNGDMVVYYPGEESRNQIKRNLADDARRRLVSFGKEINLPK